MDGAVTERDVIRELKDYTELRAVLVINNREVDVHLCNIKDPTWVISDCDVETRELAMPIVRRLYEALFQQGRYKT
ncbi:hypothetical protein [uncultured Mediterranean phage uvMED]|nr:hypothetical protein [uncultured Mediterranean phage uvMED]BAQ90335.1 hypothetical protein [uncultured Mediterranean phage uvMED]